MKKILILAAVAGIGYYAFAKKGDSAPGTTTTSSDLDGKRNGTIPLSDAEAQNYLNTYSDLKAEYGSNLEKAKWHWQVAGMAEGRTFESPTQIW